MTDVDPLASPTTELGTTAAANNPLASPDLSLPAPSWVLARPRDLGFPVPAGRATTRGLGLVGRGESVRRPGSLPRSLPDTRLPPLPLEERSRPGPLAVSVEDPWSIQGPVEGRPDCGCPRYVPLLEVAPYCSSAWIWSWTRPIVRRISSTASNRCWSGRLKSQNRPVRISAPSRTGTTFV